MKLPCHILGLIAAVGATPVIVGCAGEPSEPSPNKTDQNIQSEHAWERGDGKDAVDASSEMPSPSSADVAAPDPASASQPARTSPPPDEEDTSLAPPLEEDAPLEGGPGLGGRRWMSHEVNPIAPYAGAGTSAQDPCPACGMG